MIDSSARYHRGHTFENIPSISYGKRIDLLNNRKSIIHVIHVPIVSNDSIAIGVCDVTDFPGVNFLYRNLRF
jgi:hypothetical protein